jgi:hypothetical protein
MEQVKGYIRTWKWGFEGCTAHDGQKREPLLKILQHKPTLRFVSLSTTVSVVLSCFFLDDQVGGAPTILSGQIH